MRRFLAYFAIYILWGASFLAIRIVVMEVPAFLAAGCRFLLAGAVLCIYTGFRTTEKPNARQWRNAALLGIFMFTGTYACMFWSERILPSGLAAVLASLIPVWVLLGETLTIKGSAPLTGRSLGGALLGVGGVLLLAFPSGPQGSELTKAALVLVLGTLFWSIGTIATLRFTLPREATASAGAQMASGGLFLLVLSAAVGELRRLPGLVHGWSWQAYFSMAYLVFAASIVAFSAFVWLIAREPAARVSSYAYVNPAVALLLGFAIGHERPTGLQYGGVLVVLASVFLTLGGKQAKEATAVESV